VDDELEMKRFPLLAALALCVLSSQARAGERFHVTFFDIGEPAPFWDVFAAAAAAAADDLDIELETLNAHGDHLKMIEFAREVAARPVKPDYALINNEKGAAGRMLEALAGAGIKTLLAMSVFDGPEVARYGRPREKIPQFIGTLRPQHEQAGHDLARRLIDAGTPLFSKPIQLLAISGAKATFAATERDRGLKRALARADDVSLTQLVHSAWQREKARRQVTGLLRRWPGTKLVWAANDPMALGAMDAVRERGLVPGRDVLIGGVNWSRDALERVQSGELVTSVGGHFLGGAWALVLLRDHHDGLDFADGGLEREFPMGVIDRANVAPYLAQFAGENWGAIDFARFSRARHPDAPAYEFTLAKVLEQFR
jgi:ABC-type sugar transport system substrate-binding protein